VQVVAYPSPRVAAHLSHCCGCGHRCGTAGRPASWAKNSRRHAVEQARGAEAVGRSQGKAPGRTTTSPGPNGRQDMRGRIRRSPSASTSGGSGFRGKRKAARQPTWETPEACPAPPEGAAKGAVGIPIGGVERSGW